MSSNRKRRWEKFGNNDSSSSSDEESASRFRGDSSSSRSKFNINEEKYNKPHPDIDHLQRKEKQVLSNQLGPALPPNFPHSEQPTIRERTQCSPSLIYQKTTEDNVIGPSLPPHLQKNRKTAIEVTGPSLPPHIFVQKLTTDEVIGPSLPPHLLAQKTTIDEVIGPSLPPHLLAQKTTTDEVIGPSLPPHLLAQKTTTDEVIGPSWTPHLMAQKTTTTGEVIGPSLPPHLLADKTTMDEVIGPSLPPHLLAHRQTELMGPALPPHLLVGFQPPPEETEKHDRIMGPQLPPQFAMDNSFDESSEDDDGAIGPDPRLMASADQPLDYNVAERSERARKKMLGLDKIKPERENWMLELPPERAANLGLGARQFRGKLAPEMGDRTVWTDTPSDKAKKEGLPPKIDESELGRRQIIAERDRKMEKMARKAEKKLKRKESLLESHSKKLEKEAKDKAKNTKNEPQLRKMFSREEDMQVHKFDEAQKKAIFKKAQFLNDRFSQGESKYL